ncbi:heparinase II/III domain-containing protein [Noviherbaspirillum aridicola]|uniref:Heparinase II/III-like C-terminal domain-containing protein n=1 Tax=Noviherbaspirillum aridicola TaxID=2849687 RepID=A0ABQ4Q729_9BURK|nr:heparinase II/III family protein [Noviherbaspirillum aridicola]GIZ52854.1 hypothetical protein NCCP691_28680 [Noviherbaspirillum aridicola]
MILLAGLAVSAAAAGGAGTLQVRPATEDWEGARMRVGADETWRAWLKQESQRIETWMARERDRGSAEAGWIHEFQDEATGAFRSAPPDSDCEASRSGPQRAGCIALLRHRNMGMLHAAARLAVLTRSRPIAEWASAQLDMYARLSARTARAGAGGLFRQGLDVANVMPLLADAVRLLRPMSSGSRAAGWCDNLLLPAARKLMASQREVHNIAVWYSSAAAIAAMECSDEDLLKQTLNGPASLPALLDAGTSPDGYWLELSLGYQNYVVQAVHETLLAASLRGRFEDWQALHRPMLSLLASPLRVGFRGGDGPTINDSNRHPQIPDLGLLHRVRRTVPTAQGADAANREQDWESLLDPPGQAPLLRVRGDDGAHDIAGLKSLLLRDQHWEAILRAGQGARFHAHQDILSFELKHGDTWVFRHSPTPAYGSSLHRDYYKRAPAHNVPLVDSQGISNWFARPTATDAADSAVAATIRSFQRGVEVQRQLRTRERVFTDRLQFRAGPGAAHVFGAIYHTDCALAATPATPAASGPDPLPEAAGFGALQPQASWRSDGTWTARLTCGARSFVLRMAGSGPFTLSQLSAPALGPARRRTALLVGMEARGPGWVELQLETLPASTAGKPSSTMSSLTPARSLPARHPLLRSSHGGPET